MNATATVSTRSVPTRTVKARRVDFSYPEEKIPRHYVSGDLVMSHLLSNLSAVFPEGEAFFVRSVRNYRDRIEDPELRKQVAGFIGQEAMHGREHRAFNERLAALGYPTKRIDWMMRWEMKAFTKYLPKSLSLAMTAALEHYTATLAEVLLSDSDLRAMLDIEQVRKLWLWHALEESEHKAVAFDVYQAVSGNHLLRVGAMHAMTVMLLGGLVTDTVLSLLADPAARDLGRLRRSLRAFRRGPFAGRDVRERIGAYRRRGFHPDDRDTTALLEHWRTELFDTDAVCS
ncbi:MAG: metal-dependent hydrolase [Acidimicrobiales bacterium]